MKPYFYVYRTDESRGPKIKHVTLKDAQTEAERLANQHPGSAFEILQCLAITRCTQASTFWMDGAEPPEEGITEARYRMLEIGEYCQDGDESQTGLNPGKWIPRLYRGKQTPGMLPTRRPL